MLVSLEKVAFSYRDARIFTDVCFTLHENERVGLIGGNGEGKTTLIKLILGELVPDEGSVFAKNGMRLGYLDQTGGLDSDRTVYEEMKQVFAQDEALIERLRETEQNMAHADEETMRVLSARAESINKQIAARDSYRYDVRVRTVLNGMGFQNTYEQIISTMSGGEKTRLKLCRLLLEEPDLLILDEPTNHLDLKTLFWLEEYLSNFKGSLLVVSHDRYFLDKLTSRTLELERGKLSSYKGNYSIYKLLKAEKVALQLKEYEKQQEEIAHLQDYVDRNLVRATTAKSAQSRVKQLEKMERLEKPVPPPAPPRFSFTYAEKPYERVLTCEKFDLKAQEKVLIKNASFQLLRGQKCALTGDNGTGKTTLLKYLLSEQPNIQKGKFVKIAYYDQENADLNPEDSVLYAFWGAHSLLSQTEARKLLAQSGLQAEDMEKKVKNLSGGERAKLELALLQAKHGNVLFLDEPTNHLDLPAREALEEALCRFDGTLLFVSHDRYFIRAVATQVACIENRSLTLFDGDYESFLSDRNQKNTEEKPAPTKIKTSETGGYRSKEERAQEAKRKTRIKEVEKALEQLETEESQLNAQLTEYAADFSKIQALCKRLEEIHAQTDLLYREYETLID